MEYRWLQAISPAAWLIPIAIILAAVIGGVFTRRDSSKPLASTTGSTSPAIHDVNGGVKVHYVTNNYHGADPATVARLEELLNEKEID